MKSRKVKEDVTLKDIAEAVGKSVAAVSRALNDYDDISLETRAVVKRVAREMGYTPNPMAQRLQKKASDTLGIMMPALSPRTSDPYFSELLNGIASEAAHHHYDLLVSTTTASTDELQAYTRLVNSRRIDGMVLARPRQNDARISLLLEKDFPFVVIGPCHEPVLTVTDNPTYAAHLSVAHLVKQGHKNIALINAPLDLTFATQYLDGFRAAMLAANLSMADNVTECKLTQAEGYRVAQILLSRMDAPTAIITADDMVAFGVMAAAQDQGLEIGNDLAVVGYGDIQWAEHSQPSLTTVHRPTYAMGQQACRLLLDQLSGSPSSQQRFVFEPSLVIRQSSDLALWL